ncbi:MAG TPA: glycosyltransferase family 4 protein, partial [Candidatus Binatia bacterium]|nr:glycosyltransferase family 4 protein [Candidatus Binatia bacterium]
GKVAELDARQLAEIGFDVHVHSPAGARPDGAPYAFHLMPALLRYGNAAFVPSVTRLLRDHAAVLLHYPFFGGAEPLALAKRLSGRGRLLVTYHMDVVGKGLLRSAFALHTRYWMPSILREAERVFVTSFDYAERGALAAMVETERHRFRELAPSVDVERFVPGPRPPELLKKHGLSPDDRVVVFVGGLDRPHYFKGVPVLLRALASRPLAAVKAVIVGDGDLRPSFEALAKAPALAGRAVFTGGVSERELPSYYRLGDVFAFPSTDRSEAFGIAALEAAASGLPVVASDLPGVRTIVREGVTGRRVPVGSASALALALASVLADAPGRHAMSEAGRAMAVEEYAEPARLEKWRKLAKELGL